jgi:hypothetical protein
MTELMGPILLPSSHSLNDLVDRTDIPVFSLYDRLFCVERQERELTLRKGKNKNGRGGRARFLF